MGAKQQLLLDHAEDPPDNQLGILTLLWKSIDKLTAAESI